MMTLNKHIAFAIQSTLEIKRWNKSQAASVLGISRPRLDRYIRKFGLKDPKKNPQSTQRQHQTLRAPNSQGLS